MNHGELLLRMAVGTLLSGIIGFERDLHGRPAGLRTHMIVGLASSVFMVVSTHFIYFQHYAKEDLVAADPSRIAASVVTGIGFLAGGAILRTGLSVQGLTTAAGLWLVAAIGLCAGGGMYVESVACTAIGIGALTVLRRFEDKDDRFVRRKISLSFGETAPPVSTVLGELEALGAQVSHTEYEKHVEEKRTAVSFHVRYRVSVGNEKVLEKLESQPGVRRVRVEPIV
jgi:putative Mg2+ transporter-C (MgtC) family protein